MSYLALYRKYRPSSFNDLVGQNEVVNIIKNEIVNNKISHAYLFSGPRGTGKTSTAKIIAKMINCSHLSKDGVPCGKCDSCLNFNNSSDVVEIDAASNNGVDEIRDLRDKVNLVPSYGRFKIYIIDEVHMLTTQAFNALLKTLEEPPAHVIFILATTEFYKIPVTVVSRCQKFQFFRFSDLDIVNRLSYIANKENISVDKSVLYEIARLSDGGMRDAINMFDQLSSYSDDEIDINNVYLLNGVLSYNDYFELLNFIKNGKTVDIINFIENMDKTGKNFERFVIDFILFLKDVLVYKNDSNFAFESQYKKDFVIDASELFTNEDIYNLIFDFNDLSVRLKTSSLGKILIITELVKISNLHFANSKKSKNSSENCDSKFIANDFITEDVSNNIPVENSNFFNDDIKKIRINNAFATASKKFKDSFINNWNSVLDKLSNDEFYSSISLIMYDVSIQVVGKNNVIFVVSYDSLVDRLEKNVFLIEKLLFDVYNIDYKCVFLLDDEWKKEKDQYISNIKNGISYDYLEEKINIDVSKNKDDDIEKIVSILGNDVISYE